MKACLCHAARRACAAAHTPQLRGNTTYNITGRIYSGVFSFGLFSFLPSSKSETKHRWRLDTGSVDQCSDIVQRILSLRCIENVPGSHTPDHIFTSLGETWFLLFSACKQKLILSLSGVTSLEGLQQPQLKLSIRNALV